MADVTKISGPVPQEPNKSSEPIRPGTDKFKEFMKIGESDKRQGKKREQREEAASKKGALRTGTASEKVAEPTLKQRSPKIQKVDGSQKRQPQQKKRSEETTASDEAAPQQANTQQIKVQEEISKDEIHELEKKEAIAPSMSTAEEAQQQIAAQEEKTEVVKAFTKKQGTQKTEATSPTALAISTLGPLFIPPPPETAPGYTLLSGDNLVLFEKMVSQILTMLETGLKETTFHLNAPQYASSRFFGSQIIIREFSTAPLAFNIELLGSPQNALFFEQNIASLKQAFASEKRTFTINDIRTSIQKTERTEHRRVERKQEDEMS